jgi:hypothetical protein
VGNATEGQNVGNGTGVYKGKIVGNLLQYKSLSVTGTTMTITSDDNNIYFSANTGGGGTTISGTTNYIPKFNAGGDNIEDSLIRHDGTTIDLGYETINMGSSSTAGGNRYIKAAGTDSDIWLFLCSKGNRSVGVFGNCGLQMGTPSNWICYNGDCLYKVSFEDFCIHGSDNNNDSITACSLHLRGGNANNATSTGGNLIMCAGGNPLGTKGRIKICDLPAQSSETNVLYIDASGNLSSGATSGGGGIDMSGSTVNGLTTYVDADTICAQSGVTYNDNTKTLCVNNFIVNCAPTNSSFIGCGAGFNASGGTCSNFIGTQAGYQATDANSGNFIGYQAGCCATDACFSNFIGTQAGLQATNSINSVFIGELSGWRATGSSCSIFIGRGAGWSSNGSVYSNFIGCGAGYEAHNACLSNFLGRSAGFQATNARSSVFIGYNAGQFAARASCSTLIGWQAGKTFTSNDICGNNIIIGTNISLPDATKNAINIGNVLYGINTYPLASGNPSITPQVNGKIGIGKIPTTNELEVDGVIEASGSVCAADFELTSDERCKTNIIAYTPINADVQYRQFELCNRLGQTRYGVIAQELQNVYPEVVRTNEEGYLSISYIDLLIREVAYLKNKLIELENKIG